MKNFFLSLLVMSSLLSLSTQVFSQAPQKVNYQAVARDASGNALTSTSVNVLYEIRQSTPTGTVVYSEIHATTTNQFGLFTLEIGGGTPVTGTFAGINWGAGLYYLYMEINGDPVPATQLLSVPYALHANTATSGVPGANGHNSLTNATVEAPGVNCANGGYFLEVGADDNDDNVLQAGEVDITYYVCNGLDGTANNNDTSATNEIQALSISNDTIFLSNGGFVVLPNATGDNDWTVNGNDMSSSPSGNVGIGNPNPQSKLSVVSTDTIIANFVGTNNDAAIISVTGVSPNAAAGLVVLTGSDSGVVAMDPTQRTLFLSNTTNNGHIGIFADSSVASSARIITHQGISILNQVDSIFTFSTSGSTFHLNQGSFVTDSLYVLGPNALNSGWVLTSNGLGKAEWTNPASLGSSLWQSNVPDIFFNTGHVGIGTNNAQQLLTISDPASTTFRMERTNAAAFDWEMNVDNLGFHLKGGADAVGPGLTDFMNIDGTGRVGLGITVPTQKLHIFGGTLRIDDGANPYNLPVADGSANQVLTTDGAGNTSWQTPTAGASMSDADGDTEINVEASPDQDVIHFNLGNSTGYPAFEYFTMIGPRLEVINSGQSIFIGQGAGANDDLNFRNNVFIGHLSGNSTTTGSSNLGLGVSTLQSNISGNNNIALGDDALQNIDGGNNNIAIGVAAGNNNINGSGNVFLGHQVGLNETGSNKLYIDNSSTNTPLIWGDFANDSLKINGTLSIIDGTQGANRVLTSDANGNASWQNPASASPWTKSGTSVFQATLTDFVGIGNNSPTALLHVNNIFSTTTVAKIWGHTEMRSSSAGNVNFLSLQNVGGGASSSMEFEGANNGSSLRTAVSLRGVLQDRTVNAEGGEFIISTMTSGTLSEKVRITQSGYVGIGTATPQAKLHLVEDGHAIAAVQSSNNNTSQGGQLSLIKTRGTSASPSGVQTGDRLGKLEFVGMDNTFNFTEGVSIRGYADEPFGSTSHGSHLEFHTSTIGGGGGEVMRLTHDGLVGIGTGTPLQKLHIQNGTIRIDNGANPYTLPAADGAANQVLTTNGSGALSWQTPSGGSSTNIIDADADTYIEVEQSVDEDYIRIGTAGVERMVIDSNGLIGAGQFGIFGNVQFAISTNTEDNALGVLNVSAQPIGTSAVGLFGDASGASAGSNIGVKGTAVGAAQDNIGVQGSARGISSTDNVYGVWGEADPTSTLGLNGYGVYGEARGNIVNNYGIYGTAANGSANNYAGYFDQGNVQINNTLILPSGAGAGRILTSDAAGNSSWKEKRIAFEAFIPNTVTLPGGGFGAGSILVPFLNEVFDDGNDYDPSAGVNEFTAKVSGVYVIESSVVFLHLSGGEVIAALGLVKNGVSLAPIKVSKVTLNSPGQEKSAMISATVRLNAGDKITVETVANNPGTIDILPSESNWFSGHLVYAD